jgi:hypothetical protein
MYIICRHLAYVERCVIHNTIVILVHAEVEVMHDRVVYYRDGNSEVLCFKNIIRHRF